MVQPFNPNTITLDGNLNVNDDGTGNWGQINATTINATIKGGLTASGDTTGATDTANIQGLINLGAKVVQLGLGVFWINAPLVPAAGQPLWLRGAKGSVQAIAGAGANIGTVLKPTAGFASTLPVTGVITVINGNGTSNTAVQLAADIRDLWIDGSSGPASVDGISIWGTMQGVHIQNVGINQPTGQGINFAKNTNFGSANVAQGPYLDTIMIQQPTGVGITVTGTDGTFINCHVQGVSGGGAADGWSITGGHNQFIGCRADLSKNGFTFDAPRSTGSNSFFDGNTMLGGGTQGNQNNGINVINSSATGQSLRCPVFISGVSLDGDGVNAGAGGGGFAGLAVAGRNDVVADNLNVLVATVFATPNATPAYAVATASSGTGPGVPDSVTINSGFLNGATAITNDAAPSTDFYLGLGTRGYGGGQYASNGSTALAKPAKVPAAPLGSTPTAPAATASTTLVMMGLGTNATGTPWAFTPLSSGKVLVNVTGLVTTATAVATATFGGRFGTGTAPINGAAVSGTRFGGAGDSTTRPQSAGAAVPFALTAVLSLTAGTTYWFDLALDTNAGADAASVSDVSISIIETS